MWLQFEIAERVCGYCYCCCGLKSMYYVSMRWLVGCFPILISGSRCFLLKAFIHFSTHTLTHTLIYFADEPMNVWWIRITGMHQMIRSTFYYCYCFAHWFYGGRFFSLFSSFCCNFSAALELICQVSAHFHCSVVHTQHPDRKIGWGGDHESLHAWSRFVISPTLFIYTIKWLSCTQRTSCCAC